MHCLLRYNRFVSSYDLISAVKTLCVQTLQSSTNSTKPPLAALCTVREGGIFEKNAGGDLFQVSECSEIFYVRIPSVSFADSIPTLFGPSGHFPLIGGIGPLGPRGALGARKKGRISALNMVMPRFNPEPGRLFRLYIPERIVPTDNRIRRSTIRVRLLPDRFFCLHSSCKHPARALLLRTPFHTLHIWLY